MSGPFYPLNGSPVVLEDFYVPGAGTSRTGITYNVSTAEKDSLWHGSPEERFFSAEAV